jgi:hypothetical protein
MNGGELLTDLSAKEIDELFADGHDLLGGMFAKRYLLRLMLHVVGLIPYVLLTAELNISYC